MSDHDPYARKFERGLRSGLPLSLLTWILIIAAAYLAMRSLR